MLHKIIKIIIFPIIIFALTIPVFAHDSESLHSENGTDLQATIYYNEACGSCAKFVNTELPKMLGDVGVKNISKKDYINEKESRVQMNKIMSDLSVPFSMQGHIMTFVGDEGSYKYILGGHVPEHIINDLFKAENSQKFDRIIIYQDKMHDEAEDYGVLAMPSYATDYVGDIKNYQINKSVTEYLSYLEKNKKQLLISGKVDRKLSNYKSILPVVLVSGFLDGLNPCAFAVLLFFIAFLFSIKRTRASIWKMGAVYISAIFLAYILIGFGLMKAIMFSSSPHFMAKLGAWLVIGLGLINLINYFFPKFPIKLRIPMASKATLQTWIHKATLPAAFVLGFLVGLCTFPCSGGIYVAIIGLLAAKTTYFTGVGYLFLYNIVFVLPLVIILLLSSNKLAVKKLTKWEQSESKTMKILSAIVMLALGLVILVWFV